VDNFIFVFMKPNEIDSTIILKNNTPQDDFSGLTPNEFHQLLYFTFSFDSPLQFQTTIDNSVLDRIPFFRIAEAFLKIVEREKSIKLTALGNLPRKVVLELYENKFFLDRDIESGLMRINKEEDCTIVATARLTTHVAKLVRTSKGKLLLTKNGADFLKTENRLELFKFIFRAYTVGFNWNYNDLYPESPTGQLGFAYSMYLLHIHGDKSETVDFYAEKYLKALPKLLLHFPDEGYSSIEDTFKHCYSLRVIDHFFDWFGLADVTRPDSIFSDESTKIRKTEVFNLLFRFE
jgi:hypothetical protein